MKTKIKTEIYIVSTGYCCGESDEVIRFITLDYESAYDFAEKLVNKLNKNPIKMNKKHFVHLGLLEKTNNELSALNLAEKVTDYWRNRIKKVTVKRFLINKSYTPIWSL